MRRLTSPFVAGEYVFKKTTMQDRFLAKAGMPVSVAASFAYIGHPTTADKAICPLCELSQCCANRALHLNQRRVLQDGPPASVQIRNHHLRLSLGNRRAGSVHLHSFSVLRGVQVA